MLTVYTAKKIKIQATLFLHFSTGSGSISHCYNSNFFSVLTLGLLVLGYVIFELVNAVLLGRKAYTKYSKYFLTQKTIDGGSWNRILLFNRV